MGWAGQGKARSTRLTPREDHQSPTQSHDVSWALPIVSLSSWAGKGMICDDEGLERSRISPTQPALPCPASYEDLQLHHVEPPHHIPKGTQSALVSCTPPVAARTTYCMHSTMLYCLVLCRTGLYSAKKYFSRCAQPSPAPPPAPSPQATCRIPSLIFRSRPK